MNGVSADVIGANPSEVGVSAAEPDADGELSRLEALLAERARTLGEERAEVARLRALLNGALERLDSVAAAAETAGRAAAPAELVRARDLAVARALEAEVARAETRFKLDEALGHLAITAGSPGARPEGERPAPASPEAERVDVAHARLSGTVRGLEAALAESQEAREMLEARLLLMEHDLGDARIANRLLQRELAEAREQFELQLIAARRTEERYQGGLTAGEAAPLKAETDGLRARCDEAERALAVAAREQGSASSAHRDLLTKNGELQQALAREIENRQEVVAELGRGHAERMMLGDELTRVRAELAEARAQPGQTEARSQQQARAALTAELEATRASAAEARAELARKVDTLRATRVQLDELGAALRASGGRRGDESRMPTLIEAEEGLEVQLAASEERLRRLARTLSTASEAVRELIASAPGNSVDVAQLATIRRMLSPGQSEPPPDR